MIDAIRDFVIPGAFNCSRAWSKESSSARAAMMPIRFERLPLSRLKTFANYKAGRMRPPFTCSHSPTSEGRRTTFFTGLGCDPSESANEWQSLLRRSDQEQVAMTTVYLTVSQLRARIAQEQPPSVNERFQRAVAVAMRRGWCRMRDDCTGGAREESRTTGSVEGEGGQLPYLQLQRLNQARADSCRMPRWSRV